MHECLQISSNTQMLREWTMKELGRIGIGLSVVPVKVPLRGGEGSERKGRKDRIL
jgi:hypothetical protein